MYQHNGLFLHLVTNLINKVNLFGLHFASLDVRQESSVHDTVLEAVYGEAYKQIKCGWKKSRFLTAAPEADTSKDYGNALVNDTWLISKASVKYRK